MSQYLPLWIDGFDPMVRVKAVGFEEPALATSQTPPKVAHVRGFGPAPGA